MRVEKRVEGHTGIFLQLRPYLLADIGDGLASVRKVQVLYQDGSKLVGGYEGLVEVP